MPDQKNGRNVGKIVEIKGVVIDAVFPDTLWASRPSGVSGT